MTTSIRLLKEIIEEIEKLSKEEGIDKETIIRRLTAESLREYKKELRGLWSYIGRIRFRYGMWLKQRE